MVGSRDRHDERLDPYPRRRLRVRGALGVLSRTRAWGHRPAGRWTLGASLVAGLAVALRVVFFIGVVNVDPFTYADAAISITRGEPVFDPDLTGHVYYTQYVRLTIIAPAALLYWAIGVSDIASAAFPIALSALLAVSGFWFGTRVAGAAAGAATGFLFAIFPVHVVNSTQFLPDAPQAAFVALSVLLFLRILWLDAGPRESIGLAFVAGASLALAFYARGTAVAALPGLAAVTAAAAKARRRWFAAEVAAAAAGAATVLVSAQVLLVSLGAGPFEDLRILYEQTGSNSPSATTWDYLDLVVHDAMFWPFTAATLAGTLSWAMLARRSHRQLAILGSLVVISLVQYVYFEFFMSLPNVVTWWKEPRYILPMVYTGLPLAGVGLGLLFTSASRRTPAGAAGAGGLVACTLLVVSVVQVEQEHSFWVDDDNRWDLVQRDLAGYIEGQPERTIFVWNDDFARPLSYRLGGAGTWYERLVSRDARLQSRLGPGGESAASPVSYVVILESEGWWASPAAPAAHWERVWGGEGAALYLVPDPVPANRFPAPRPLSPPISLGPVALTAATLSESVLPPPGHLAMALSWSAPLSEPLALTAFVECEEKAGPATRITLPAGVTDLSSDLFLRAPAGAAGDCMLSFGSPAGIAHDVAPLGVPAFARIEAEEIGAAPWRVVTQSSFSGGAGLVTTADSSALSLPIPGLPAGRYWIDIRIWAYEEGEGAVVAELNGARSATATWSMPGGEHPRPLRITTTVETALAGDTLELSFMRGTQPAVLVDGIAISSYEPPPAD